MYLETAWDIFHRDKGTTSLDYHWDEWDNIDSFERFFRIAEHALDTNNYLVFEKYQNKIIQMHRKQVRENYWDFMKFLG